MKLVLMLLIGLSLLAPAAFGELSLADVEKIRAIVAESETRLRAEIAASEKRMCEYVSQEIKIVSQEIEVVNVTIAEMDKRLGQIFILVMGIGCFYCCCYRRAPNNRRDAAKTPKCTGREN